MDNSISVNSSTPSRGTRIAARIITSLLTLIWIFFGTQYFGNKETIDAIHGHLGYPLYIIPVIGITHILGGIGLQIPNMSGDAFVNFLHPVFLIILVLISYYLRRRMGGSIWKKG